MQEQNMHNFFKKKCRSDLIIWALLRIIYV